MKFLPLLILILNIIFVESDSDDDSSVIVKKWPDLASGTMEQMDNKDKINQMDEVELKQYKAELKAEDNNWMLGPNQHRYQPDAYRVYDLGRRFVPQYPYKEINKGNRLENDEDPSLIPKRATPELVLAIAKESELMQNALPVDPKEHILKKESLRSGNYWNAFWKEDVEDPTNVLRSPRRSKLDTMTAKLSPGTPIYEYFSKIGNLYPKLLYVINKTK